MKRILFLLLVLVNVAFVTAQDSGAIVGTITDNEMQEEPLLFANVTLENTLWSAQTNFHGNFEFTEVPEGNYTLIVTYLGYETMETPVAVKAGEVTSILKGLTALSMDTQGIEISHAKVSALSTADDKASKSRD